MAYTLKITAQFKRDFRLMLRQGQRIELLKEVVGKLANGEPLPEPCHDHALTGNLAGHRECHVAPDWLLIYRIFNDILVLELTRTGTHAALFRK